MKSMKMRNWTREEEEKRREEEKKKKGDRSTCSLQEGQ
jgi:hypothetical protein